MAIQGGDVKTGFSSQVWLSGQFPPLKSTAAEFQEPAGPAVTGQSWAGLEKDQL